MLKYANHDIVFQEFPDEVTLAVNLTGCPCHCPGCHSQYLWDDNGEMLDITRLLKLADHYGRNITCVALMGGDAEPQSVISLLAQLRQERPFLRTGWYSGRPQLPECFAKAAETAQDKTGDPLLPDYVKTGPYIESLGPLSAPTTNQRLYRYHRDGRVEDLTPTFWKKGLKL